MYITYDIEVFKYDWLIVFKENNDFTVICNDVLELKDYINKNRKKILIGFNNYNFDDVVLASILLGKDPYIVSHEILRGIKQKVRLNMITLDMMQELPSNVSLKAIEGNLGYSIIETPIDFKLDRSLTEDEINEVVRYCINDVIHTEYIFKIREDYYKSKVEIIKEFNLPIKSIRLTRANLASTVLKCKFNTIDDDRLNFEYYQGLNLNIIPKDIVNFYNKAKRDYLNGVDYKEIEARQFTNNILGVEHIYGFGGLHGALNNYIGTGKFLHIDVSSFYPSLIIEGNYMSRNSIEPQLYKIIKEKRLQYKKQNDPRQGIYKIILNSTFGAMKSKFNKLYDPKQANNICINGQLILTQLILELGKYSKLIQSNTDGIIIKYKEENLKTITNIIEDFSKRMRLKFDVDYVTKVIQRDVNNYVVLFEDGRIYAKGRFAKFDGGNYIQNNLSIIDTGLVNYYIKGISPEATVLNLYKENKLESFQIICKMGSSYDGIFYEYNGQMKKTQKVNRVFATTDSNHGGIYKKKGNSFQKIANTSNHSIIHNEDLILFDKKRLDLNYYIELIKNNFIKEGKEL